MGRNPLDISKEDLSIALLELPTQGKIADHFNCSQATISNKMKEFGLEAKANGVTIRDSKIEFPEYTWEEAKELLRFLEKTSSPTVGYNNVTIEIETNSNIMIIPQADWHYGCRHMFAERHIEDIEFIASTPNVFAGLNGDYCDNYNTSSYKGGQIDQSIKIQHQKALAETAIKKLEGKILWFINGCHDEWSYFNDGFDFAQLLSHKDQQGYYLGHWGFIDLIVGDIKYKIFATHNTYRNSTINKSHGLSWVCREHGGFDIGIQAHNHVPYTHEFIQRGKRRYSMCCGAYKAEDRHVSKSGFPKTKLEIPGFILNPRKKEVIMNIDYREIVKYM